MLINHPYHYGEPRQEEEAVTCDQGHEMFYNTLNEEYDCEICCNQMEQIADDMTYIHTKCDALFKALQEAIDSARLNFKQEHDLRNAQQALIGVQSYVEDMKRV